MVVWKILRSTNALNIGLNMDKRSSRTFTIVFPAGATDSNMISIELGYYGNFLVNTGSEAVAKTIQVIAVADDRMVTKHNDTTLLTTPKTLAAGANALSTTETNELAAACCVKFRLSAAVTAATTIWLMWKS